ncbi:MAG: IclR family transcriptional regulator [Leucobacter sp.]
MADIDGSPGRQPRRGGRPAVGEPVLDRMFRILSAFSDAERALSLSRLSELAKMPVSTTLRIARGLVDIGALERGPDGRFTIGLWLLERATLAPRGHGLRHIALPYMEDLHRATDEHILLAVREGDVVLLIERLSSRGASLVDYRVGGQLPLHTTGVGLVLLANSPPDFQKQYLSQPLIAIDGSPISPARLGAHLELIRTKDVCHLSRTVPDRAVSVATPVRQHGTVIAALSVVAAEGRLRPAMIEPAVTAIARAISREISKPQNRIQDMDLRAPLLDTTQTDIESADR